MLELRGLRAASPAGQRRRQRASNMNDQINQWYLRRGEASNGPLRFEALVQLVRDGALAPRDLIWRVGWAGWAEAGTVPGLFIPPSFGERPEKSSGPGTQCDKQRASVAMPTGQVAVTSAWRKAARRPGV